MRVICDKKDTFHSRICHYLQFPLYIPQNFIDQKSRTDNTISIVVITLSQKFMMESNNSDTL